MKKSIFFNRISFLSVCCIALFSLTNCTDEFLDEPSNIEGLPTDAIYANRANADTHISGIMRRYRSQYTATDTGGLYSQFFARTIKGNDLIQSVNWYQFDYDHGNREPNFRRTVFNWSFNYDMIAQANSLIAGAQNSINLSELDKKELVATGKAIRAYHYFQLALDFAPNLITAPTIEKLPMYLELVTGTTVPKAPISTRLIYNQILKDLREAIIDLPESRLGKSYINRSVANGILAQVLLVTQDDWSSCSIAAEAAYGGGNANTAAISSGWTTGMADVNDPEWIWGMYQDPIESNFFFAAPHAFTDHTVLSYAATYVNSVFVANFASNDVRRKFVDFYGVPTPWRKFVTTKFAFSTTSDMPIMRKSEMILAHAEAQYRLGNTTVAKNLLFALQSRRIPGAIISTNIGTSLLEEILLERRKELYGETGVEFFDAKRLQRPIVRDNVHRTVLTVPSNSDLFYLKIPQLEIDRNPNMNPNINN